MFTSFFYTMKSNGLDISTTEWLTLMEALDKGLANSSFTDFYYLCRTIFVKNEGDYDKLDAALESKSEGIILGIMSNMFKLAGAVIVAGVVSAFVIGTIIFLFR